MTRVGRKRWLLAPLAVLLLFVGGWFWQTSSARKERDQEVAALQALGAPTNASEMRSLATVPPEDNAAPLYLKALELFAVHGKQMPSPTSFGTWSAEDEARVRKWVSDNKETLDVLKQASRKPSCDFEREWEEGMNLLLPEFADLKACTKLVVKRSEIEAEAGRFKAAMEWLDVGRAIAHHADEPILIGTLVAIACESIVLAEFQRQLETYGKQASFRAAASEFVNRKTPMPSLTRGLAGEVFFARVAFDMLGRDQLSLDDISHLSLGGESESSFAGQLVGLGLRVPMVRYRVETKLLKRYRLALEEIRAGKNSLASQSEASRLLDVAAVGDRTFTGRLAEIFTPAFAQAGAAIVALEAKRRMSRCALAVWTQRAAAGRFPSALPEGIDSTDPFTGEPFVYQVDNGHVVMYSVGPNKMDEGGRRSPGRASDDLSYARTLKR